MLGAFHVIVANSIFSGTRERVRTPAFQCTILPCSSNPPVQLSYIPSPSH
uniref:Uncharacterized protein n=1 Tax=Arundo donax TaxID=35708 RepID=A0A0A9BQN7_ARUDO